MIVGITEGIKRGGQPGVNLGPGSMFGYLVRRVGGTVVVFLLVSLIVFLILNVLPGDPARLIAGPEATQEAYQRIRALLGLDRPWPQRYLAWLGGIFRGEWGVSLNYRRDVERLLGEAMGLTVPLAFLAAAMSLVLALPLGIVLAVRPRGLSDLLITALSQLGMAFPEFWTGIILVGFLSLRLHLLPAGGFPGWDRGPEALKYLLLPGFVLALPRAAYLARMVRGNLLEVLGSDFVRSARAKGLPEWVVVLRHGLRPALIPVVTALGLLFGQLLAGAIVVENVFYLPGLGHLALKAVMSRDIPLMQGLAVWMAGVILLVNLVTDISYGLLDPRVRYR